MTRSNLGACPKLNHVPIVLLATIVTFVLAACAAPQPQSFNAFAKASSLLEASGDKLVAGLASGAGDRTTRQVLAGDLPSRDLILSQGVSTLEAAASPNAPYLIRLPAFRTGLVSFNRAIANYARGLVALADPAVIDDKAIDTLATDTNGALRSFGKQLGIEGVDNDFALVSTIAAEAFRAFQRSEQRAHLLEALRAVQERMPEIAEQGQQGTTIIALAAWQEYEARSGDLRRVIEDTTRSEKDRTAAIASLLELNAAHASTLASLSSLSDAYGQLPDAHANLIASLQHDAPLDAVQRLLENAQRIDALHTSIQSAK